MRRLLMATIVAAFLSPSVAFADPHGVGIHSSDHFPQSSRRPISVGAQIVGHPSGCPTRAFCGCGTALHVFGKHVRDLWLAKNWLRFPRTAPAPGMVAARRGHVFAILAVHGDGTVTAYDPNSGGRKTRIHRRSLAGFTVVNPRAG